MIILHILTGLIILIGSIALFGIAGFSLVNAIEAIDNIRKKRSRREGLSKSDLVYSWECFKIEWKTEAEYMWRTGHDFDSAVGTSVMLLVFVLIAWVLGAWIW